MGPSTDKVANGRALGPLATRPGEGLSPTTEQKLAGWRKLPPKSVPVASHTWPAAKATADLKPKLGRAKNHSDKSVGHPDPGAVSFALITAAAGATLAQLKERSS